MNFHPKALLFRIRDHKEKAGICLIWLLINGLLLWKNGIVTTGEAEKYINEARVFLSTGGLGSSNFRFYFLPIALISLCIRLHLSFAWMVAVQLVFNGLATFFFYQTATMILPTRKAALIGTLLLLLNIPYQAFNSFLQTESLFQSASLLLICLMARPKQLTARRIAIILFLLLFLSATRPNGLIYWPIVWLFISFTSLRQSPAWLKISVLTLGLALFIFLLNYAMGSGGELDFILPFREQHIICGVPTLISSGKVLSHPEDNSILGLFGYIFHHFGLFIRLAILKSCYFWGLYRNYFSGLHNGYLVIYFYPPALAALVSLGYWRRYNPLALYCLLAPVLLTWLMVILTCDDWHNRVYLGISPFLLLLGLPILTPGKIRISRLKRPRS
jgi:hypothetical protein